MGAHSRRRKAHLRRFLGARGRALLVLAVLGGATAGVVLYAWSAGWSVYVVRKATMAPDVPAGAVVLDRPATAVQAGAIVTVRAPDGAAGTRRVVRVLQGGAVQTETLNPPLLDTFVTPPSRILGRTFATIPVAGDVIRYVRRPIGMATLVIVALGLLVLVRVAPGATPAARAVGRRDDAPPDDASGLAAAVEAGPETDGEHGQGTEPGGTPTELSRPA